MAISIVLLYILMAIGPILIFIGQIWVLVIAFRMSTRRTFLFVLFVPFYSLSYISNNWSICKKPFLMALFAAIIVILIAFGVGAVDARTKKLHDQVINDMTEIRPALESYAWDNEQFPTKEQGLEALIKKPTAPPVPKKWNGPYLAAPTDFRDPWGNKYIYAPSNTNGHDCELYSLGKDGKDGGREINQDISSERGRVIYGTRSEWKAIP